jgi:hypothetical protein
MGSGDEEKKMKKKDKKKDKEKKPRSKSPSLDKYISKSPTKSPTKQKRTKRPSIVAETEKYSVEYFAAILTEVKEKCEKKIKMKEKERNSFTRACEKSYTNWHKKMENEKYLDELLESKGATKEEIDEAQRFSEEATKAQSQHQKHAMKTALKIFKDLDGDKMEDIEDKLVKGAIIAQSTPESLADFSAKGQYNKKLIKRLFNDPKLMKEMLRNGGASQYKYGNAMKIYVECTGDDHNEDNVDKWDEINKKIALAVALEFAAPQREFDTNVFIDAVARYKHYEAAHRKGELDPAFPHFSVWEMRQIVNCDAPNDQMTWCREMVMNYCPHVTCITKAELCYTYILDTDVRIRPPKWSGNPRTYQMVLSGGGNVSVNSWFALFILKSFGLPAWGTEFRRKRGYTRWTPEGWKAMNGADWDTSYGIGSSTGKAGMDFKVEVEARNKAPPNEYFKKLVYLKCLADVVDGDPSLIPEEEKDVLHPRRFWRSMSTISMALLFATDPEAMRTFERKGESLVVTKCEKYLEAYETDAPDKEIKLNADKGKITIPGSRHNGVAEGNLLVIASFGGGQQLNFFADGIVEYELPEDAPSKTYTVVLTVCTVSERQTPLVLKLAENPDNSIDIKVPYTVGKWSKTEPVQIAAGPGANIRFSRAKNSLGLAIKKIILS